MNKKNNEELKTILNNLTNEKLYNIIIDTLHKIDKFSLDIFSLTLTEYKTRFSILEFKYFCHGLDTEIRNRLHYKIPEKILGGIR